MDFSSILATAGTLGSLVLVFVIVGVLALKFYTLSSKEKAFIRTGVGGEKVVMNGGAFVIPGIHKVIWVNMKTLKLDVERKGKDSLVAGDKMRVDVRAEFFVRVKADAPSVSTAAQTLGEMTLDARTLSIQVEAKFVDALRAVAAKMTMHELHEKRGDFVQAVQTSVAEDLMKNGLELESVSLTSLNQTDKEFFDPNNAFDAEGLAQLTRQTEARRKDINAVQQETRVEIAKKDLQATEQTLTLKRAQSEAELRNAREIATMTAEQEAEVARVQAEGRQRAESAELEANQNIAQKRIQTERTVAEAEAEKKKAVETAQITAQTAVQLASQEQAITVANKSKDEAAAAAEAAAARAEAVRAEERVTTAREVEIAERRKQVTLVSAEERAKQESIGVVVAAQAEREAADNRAEAVLVAARATRDSENLRAEAIKATGSAEAEALRLRNEALNLLSPQLLAQQVQQELIKVLPAIITASVKPLENIESIRIADIGGLGGATQGGSAGAGAGATGSATQNGLADQVVTAALRHRAHAPMVDSLMKQVGLSGADLNSVMATVTEMANNGGAAAAPETAAEAPKAE